MRMIKMMKAMMFRTEYSLRALPQILFSTSPPPSVLTDWHPLSNFLTFLKWCDSHSYYKYRDALIPNPLIFYISYSVMLHKQGKV